MDRFEMIEKLRERADITYEEAREVLEQANDDLLEAVVILEKQGKIRQPQAAAAGQAAGGAAAAAGQSASEAAAAAGQAASDAAAAGQAANAGSATRNAGASSERRRRARGAFSKAVHKVANFLVRTTFHITLNDKEIFVMPSWAIALLLGFFWHTLVPVMLVSLFFNVRFFFDGAEDVQAANEVLEKAGSFVDGVESSMKKNENDAEA